MKNITTLIATIIMLGLAYDYGRMQEENRHLWLTIKDQNAIISDHNRRSRRERKQRTSPQSFDDHVNDALNLVN